MSTGAIVLAVVGLAIFATCFSCFFRPAIGAYLPSLVRDERELGPANSLFATLGELSFIIGPALGGLGIPGPPRAPGASGPAGAPRSLVGDSSS